MYLIVTLSICSAIAYISNDEYEIRNVKLIVKN